MAYNVKRLNAPIGQQYYYNLSIRATEKELTEVQKQRNVSSVEIIGMLTSVNVNFAGGTSHVLRIYWYDTKRDRLDLIAEKGYASIPYGGSISVSQTIEVEHNSDGTLSGFAYVFFEKKDTNIYVPESNSLQNDLFELTTIPRATKINDYTATIDKILNINWLKASFTFTHKLEVQIGEYYQLIGENLVDGTSWTPNASLYDLLKESISTDGKLLLTTYTTNSEGTKIQIGERQEGKLTLRIDENVVRAEIETYSIRDENPVTIALTGDRTTLIMNKSSVFLELAFLTKKYAKAQSVFLNDKMVEISAGQEIDEETTRYVIQNVQGLATTGNYVIRIVDNRGIEISASTTNEIINYVPIDNNLSMKRKTPTTGEINVEFSGNYFGKSFGQEENQLTIKYKYKKSSEETYSEVIDLTENTDFKTTENNYYSGSGDSMTAITLGSLLDYRNIYNVVFYISDKLTDLPPINAIIVKGIPIMWWNSEKVTINGDLKIADENGENVVDVLEKLNTIPEIKTELTQSDNATYSCNYINEATKKNYIYDETLIGTSETGENLYRKIYTFTTSYNRADTIIDATELNINEVLEMDGICGVHSSKIPINFSYGTYYCGVRYYDKKFYVNCSNEYGGMPGRLIIEYTKTN